MKKIIILIICPLTLFSQSKNINKYKEFNFGVYANFDDGFIFPGASFLFGKKNYFNKKFLLDYQIGIAFPSIFTGKIGVGLGNKKYARIFGIRVYPSSTYIQLSFNERNNISFEYLPFSQYMPAVEYGSSTGIIISYGYCF